MKRYKLLKDWNGTKAGTVSSSGRCAGLSFNQDYNNGFWGISEDKINKAIEEGLIEEIQEEKFKDFKIHIKNYINNLDKFKMKYEGLVLDIHMLKDIFVIQILEQDVDWSSLEYFGNTENDILITSSIRPLFKDGHKLFLRGESGKDNHNIIIYQDENYKEKLYDILVALKYAEEHLYEERE